MYKGKERASYFWHRKRQRHAEPEAAVFSRLRLHLILWYSCMLSGMLLVVSLALYLTAVQIINNRMDNELSFQIDQIKLQWQASPTHTCPLPTTSAKYNIACFSSKGILIRHTGLINTAFLANTLAKIALRESPQSSILGGLYSYAQVIPTANGHGILGVIQFGEPNISHPLGYTWFLIVGILIFFTTPLGGFWLANRALKPARIVLQQQKAFIANVSHELRTPLALLRANAEVLLRGREHMRENDIELLQDIVADAAHMGALATNMLLLARIDSGQLHMEQEVLDLSDIANSVLRRARSLAAQMHITLQTKNCNPTLVLGDRVMLEQVILILLDNALKYNQPEGCVTVSIYLNKTQAYLEVCDSGIGIASKHLPHIGERFYRVDKSRSSEVGGSGLGLSIARNIATAHHGTLTLNSTPDQGTTVILALPAIHSHL